MPNEVFIEEKNYLTALQLALNLSSDSDIHDVLRTISDLYSEVERMRVYINRNEDDKGTYCAFCFERYPLDNVAAEQVQAHVFTCPKHPMRKLEEENKRLRDELSICKNQ